MPDAPASLRLTLGDDRVIDDPSPEAVRASLRTLGDLDASFAILGRSELDYVQTAGDPDSGYLVECQLGSLDEHYRSASYEVSRADTEAVFLGYLAGDPQWRDRIVWVREPLGQGGRSWAALFGLAVAALFFLLWWSSR